MPEARGAAALIARGGAEIQQGQGDAAIATFREALRLQPGHPAAVRALGVLLVERARLDEALALADATLRREPRHGQALLLRGEALANLTRFDEAIVAYEAALAASGPAYEILTQIGLARATLQQHQAALAALDRAIAMRPDDPFARYRRGIVRLQMRDFAGWADYEARLDLKRFLPTAGGVINAQLQPLITRGPSAAALAGQRVLLLGEQGVGDQIMFASMVPDLAAVAASIQGLCEPRLARLLSASFPNVPFVGPQDAAIRRADIDQLVAMGSLGGMFRTSEAAFPGAPYLSPSAQVRDRWARRVGPRRGPRIGISWRGGLPNTRRDQRSLSLSQLQPLLDLPGCEIVNLQYGDVAEELAAANAGRANPIRAFPAAEIDDFEDLAGLVANLDLVVSVQTTLVHLAGAIGAPCLTLVPFNAEWRYTAHGPTMPWYRSVRLFRQAAPGAWDPVIGQVVDEVRARLAPQES